MPVSQGTGSYVHGINLYGLQQEILAHPAVVDKAELPCYIQRAGVLHVATVSRKAVSNMNIPALERHIRGEYPGLNMNERFLTLTTDGRILMPDTGNVSRL